MADMIKFFKGLEASLPTSGVNGALYITTDEGAIYLGTGTGMKRLGDFVQVANVASLPEKAHESCLYYCVAENILAKWNGSEWKQINKQKTLAELGGVAQTAYNEKMTALEKADSDNATAISGVDTRLQAAEEKLKSVATTEGLGELTDRVTTAEGEIDTLQAASHTHTFADSDVEDAIAKKHAHTFTDTDVEDAIAKKHAHTFVESELNKIADGDVAKWNAAEKNAKDYADGLDGAMNTRVEALETAIGENGSVATQIKTAIEALDFTDVAVDGEYVSAVNEVDGKISVTRKALPDYTNTYDAKGAADTAFENAKAYADGLASNYDEKGAAAGVKTELEAEIAKKVDKVDGKSLVSDTEITKLAGISEGANKVEASANNGSIKIDGVDTVVYTHPTSHTVSEISDFDEKVKAYDYATKTEAQSMADGKDEAIAAAKKAGDDAQDAIDAYIESNDTALAGVKATANAAAVKTEVETALAERYTKTEADGKFAIKGEDSYDDTALAGRVTTAEGKITALEGASATHATKDELNAVDAKFADYTKTADLPTDLGDFTNNAGYAKTADVNTELDKKADKTQVATDIANAIAPLATTEALNGVDAKFANYTNTTDMNAKFELKADKTALETTDKTLADVKATVDNFFAEDAAVNDTIDTLKEIAAYIATDKEGAADITARVGALEGKVDVEKVSTAIADAVKGETDRATEAEGVLSGRIDTLEAIDHDAYKAADTALHTVISKEIDDDVKALADGQVKTNTEAIATKANSADVYAKSETFTKDEVNAAIAAAVEQAHTWGSF